VGDFSWNAGRCIEAVLVILSLPHKITTMELPMLIRTLLNHAQPSKGFICIDAKITKSHSNFGWQWESGNWQCSSKVLKQPGQENS
jgi:hypothetical protein